MIVDVDETRGDDEPCAVDHGIAARRCAGADRDHTIADEADVGAPERAAAAVGEVGADNRPAAVIHLRGRSRREEGQRERDARRLRIISTGSSGVRICMKRT